MTDLRKETELFEAFWKQRQRETWSSPPDEPGEHWRAAFKPDARRAWMTCAERIAALQAEVGRTHLEVERLVYALQRMVDMMDFHYKDGHIPENETNVPLEYSRRALQGSPPRHVFVESNETVLSDCKKYFG